MAPRVAQHAPPPRGVLQEAWNEMTIELNRILSELSSSPAPFRRREVLGDPFGDPPRRAKEEADVS